MAGPRVARTARYAGLYWRVSVRHTCALFGVAINPVSERPSGRASAQVRLSGQVRADHDERDATPALRNDRMNLC